MSEERRKSPRKRLVHSPFFSWRGRSGTHEGSFHNISLEGCFVSTGGSVHLGERVSFEISDPAGEVVSFSGTVIHRGNVEVRGFGMKFTMLSGNARNYLRLIRPVRPL